MSKFELISLGFVAAGIGGVVLVVYGIDRMIVARRANRSRVPGALMIAFGGAIASFAGLLVYVLSQPYSKGRILRIRNRAALPSRATGPGWTEPIAPDTGSLGAMERAVIAEAWHLSARMEHASIAAFSQLALHLTALGAPSELLERTHRAALDEVAHARLCFSLASAFAGRTLTAGPIEALANRSDLARVDVTRLACGSLLDGCLAEGLAADVAARGAAAAIDPVVRAVLETIARDEREHAELGWSIVELCILRGGTTTTAALKARVSTLETRITPRLPELPGVTKARLEQHGFVHQEALGEMARARVEATAERCLRLIRHCEDGTRRARSATSAA